MAASLGQLQPSLALASGGRQRLRAVGSSRVSANVPFICSASTPHAFAEHASRPATSCCTGAASTSYAFEPPQRLSPRRTAHATGNLHTWQPWRRRCRLRTRTAAAVALADVTEDELNQLAEQYGYSQIGRPIPEGATLDALVNVLPPEVFDIKPVVAFGRLLLSVGLMAAGYWYAWYMRGICPLWQQALTWLAVGVGYFGLFVGANDCARFVLLPQDPLLQDVLGATLMLPSLYSYETWRLQWFNHMLHVNMLDQDTDAWHPITKARLAAMNQLQRVLTWLAVATPLKLLASVGHCVRHFGGFDLQQYDAQSRPWVLLSWALPFAFMAVAWPAMLAAGGVAGWVNWWLMPWLVFHGILSTLSLIQHTAPHIPVKPPGLEYDQGQAAVNGTVTLLLPRWLELLLQDANYHLPQHLSPAVPFYRLRAAHAALRERLAPYINEARPCWKLFHNLIFRWQVWDEDEQCYVTWAEAMESLRRRQQQQQEATQQAQQQQQTSNQAWQQQPQQQQQREAAAHGGNGSGAAATGPQGEHGNHAGEGPFTGSNRSLVAGSM